ncbi:uncharacterized protein LOC102802199, partial [Saccoglossus kowalevskii]|uniref:Uncharacterized protein LOC102802199 n=1 Tax=Saccoglossus kowalevskii TaxID=10224 RepID=A0ABM0MR96_SACKO
NKDVDLFSYLEKDILQFSLKGDVLLVGDFNARIGSLDDRIDDSKNMHLPLPSYYINDNLGNRNTMVVNSSCCINKFGKKIIQLCIDCNLIILNGRTIGDSTGKYTCHTPQGSSTIDYGITSKNLCDSLQYFKVADLSHLSDHCALTLSTKININMCLNENNKSNDKLDPLPSKYMWNDQAKDNYQTNLEKLNNNEIKNFMSKPYSIYESETAVTDFENLITNIADKCLKKITPKLKKNKRKSKQKNWFDQDCWSLRKELRSLSRLLQKYPQDPYIRGKFFQTRKQYKKLIKHKSNQKMIAQLKELENSKSDTSKFWKILREMNGENPSNNNGNVQPGDWLVYFKTLLNTDSSTSNSEIANELENSEKSASSNPYLDRPILKNEITKAIRLLKSNKASAEDRICNELLKYGEHHLLDAIHKLFNIVYSSNNYPHSWSTGLLVPIHKSGSKNNPANYRGIAISSCLGKLFNSILNIRLTSFLDSNNILSGRQFGFRHDCRTTDNLFILKTLVNKYLYS